MIRAKDIQRIIAANETAQEASIEIKEFVDNYVEQQLKNCNLQNVIASAYKQFNERFEWQQRLMECYPKTDERYKDARIKLDCYAEIAVELKKHLL